MSGVRVLLVEDNELNSEIAVALLESLGAAAETAANGQEALDALDASEPGHFDVVLMDIQMRRGVDVVDGRGDAESSLRHSG